MTPREPARAHVYVSGTVQGVNYRWTCREEANDLGLSGWVRNLADGRVEAVFEGPRDAVDRIVAWCRRGPPHAEVTDVAVTWEAPRGDLRGFRIAT